VGYIYSDVFLWWVCGHVVCWLGAQVSGCGVTEGGEDASSPLLWHVSACTPHGTVPRHT